MNTVRLIGAALFAMALVHTFAAKQFARLAVRHPRHAGLFHLFGEVEVVFGLWAFVLILAIALLCGGAEAMSYAESRQYKQAPNRFVVGGIATFVPPQVCPTKRVAAQMHGLVVSRGTWNFYAQHHFAIDRNWLYLLFAKQINAYLFSIVQVVPQRLAYALHILKA